MFLRFRKEFEAEISHFMWLKGLNYLYLYKISNDGNYGR